MNTETNKTSVIPTTSGGKDLLKDMVQELRNFTSKVPALFETFLYEYIEVNQLTEKELRDIMQVHYPETPLSVHLVSVKNPENIILGAEIDSAQEVVDGGIRINYTLTIAGSILDEVEKYPKTKQFLEDIENGRKNTCSPTGE